MWRRASGVRSSLRGVGGARGVFGWGGVGAAGRGGGLGPWFGLRLSPFSAVGGFRGFSSASLGEAGQFEENARRLFVEKLREGRERDERGVGAEKGSRDQGTYYHGQWENMRGPPYRQARLPLAPLRDLKSRQIPELRESAEGQNAGFLWDILEHEAYLVRFREADSGGAFADGSIADFDAYSEEDAMYNEVLTEDELLFPVDWEPRVHVPDAVRQEMFFLWNRKGVSLRELSRRFGLRTERVSGILALKRGEADEMRKGTWTDRLERAMTEMSGGWKGGGESEEGEQDVGLNTVVLTDAQLPEDVVPKLHYTGDAIRLAVPTPRLPIPEKSSRTFHSAFAFHDISHSQPQHRPNHVVVSHKGKRAPATPLQHLYRSGTPRRRAIKPNRK